MTAEDLDQLKGYRGLCRFLSIGLGLAAGIASAYGIIALYSDDPAVALSAWRPLVIGGAAIQFAIWLALLGLWANGSVHHAVIDEVLVDGEFEDED